MLSDSQTVPGRSPTDAAEKILLVVVLVRRTRLVPSLRTEDEDEAFSSNVAPQRGMRTPMNMNRSETVIHLSPHLFTEKEKPFIEAGPLSASVFRFETGVCGLRLKNEVGATRPAALPGPADLVCRVPRAHPDDEVDVS